MVWEHVLLKAPVIWEQILPNLWLAYMKHVIQQAAEWIKCVRFVQMTANSCVTLAHNGFRNTCSLVDNLKIIISWKDRVLLFRAMFGVGHLYHNDAQDVSARKHFPCVGAQMIHYTYKCVWFMLHKYLQHIVFFTQLFLRYVFTPSFSGTQL